MNSVFAGGGCEDGGTRAALRRPNGEGPELTVTELEDVRGRDVGTFVGKASCSTDSSWRRSSLPRSIVESSNKSFGSASLTVGNGVFDDVALPFA